MRNNSEEPAKEKPLKDDMLWENKNMDLKPHLENDHKKAVPQKEKSPENAAPNKPSNQNDNLTKLNDLPSITKKKGALEPLDFNPKEEDKFSDSEDKKSKVLKKLIRS